MEALGLASRDMSWSTISTEALLAELSRRDDADTKPQCGSKDRGDYNTPIHVGALILILTLSTLACAIPLFSGRSKKNSRRKQILFYCQHLGTGVLIATAFVHLLPTAFSSLTDPCLPHFFSKGYKPFAGFIAMVFALAVVGLESYLHTRGAGHSHSHTLWEDESDNGHETVLRAGMAGLASRRVANRRPGNIAMGDIDASEGLIAGVSPLPESTPTIAPNDKPGADLRASFHAREDDDDDEDIPLSLDELDPIPMNDGTTYTRVGNGAGGGTKSMAIEPAAPHMPSEEEQRHQFVQVLLLEAGILFHSVFIGMGLSVATGPSFAVFLAAIALHQCFEGLALGSRIAAIHFPRSSWQPWIMVLAFGATTPLGQFIGLIVHNLYDPRSAAGLLVVGIMNAISSGLLLFAGLVQLLAQDFLQEDSYKTLRGSRRVKAYVSVVVGAFLMAGVGAIA